MASSPQSYQKRQREQAKREKAAAKRARRHSRDESDDAEELGVDEDALLERFRLLNERKSNGAITDEEFEAERAEIFERLGLGEA